MKITFLGTGTSQGIPVIACKCAVCMSDSPFDKRLRTSVLIEDGDSRYVIDAGPDFRQQMLRADVQRLDAILLTHEHKDHIGGLDDVRAFNFKSRKAMDIYCDERVKEAIEREYLYVFSESPYPGVPLMNIRLIGDSIFDIKGRTVTPVRVNHHKLPVYGFRFGDFTYLTDVKSVPEESLSLIKGTRCLIINALRKERHISHFTLDEALDFISLINPDVAYITHIGHQMGLYHEVSSVLPENVYLAYDGLEVEVD